MRNKMHNKIRVDCRMNKSNINNCMVKIWMVAREGKEVSVDVTAH